MNIENSNKPSKSKIEIVAKPRNQSNEQQAAVIAPIIKDSQPSTSASTKINNAVNSNHDVIFYVKFSDGKTVVSPSSVNDQSQKRIRTNQLSNIFKKIQQQKNGKNDPEEKKKVEKPKMFNLLNMPMDESSDSDDEFNKLKTDKNSGINKKMFNLPQINSQAELNALYYDLLEGGHGDPAVVKKKPCKPNIFTKILEYISLLNQDSLRCGDKQYKIENKLKLISHIADQLYLNKSISDSYCLSRIHNESVMFSVSKMLDIMADLNKSNKTTDNKLEKVEKVNESFQMSNGDLNNHQQQRQSNVVETQDQDPENLNIFEEQFGAELLSNEFLRKICEDLIQNTDYANDADSFNVNNFMPIESEPNKMLTEEEVFQSIQQIEAENLITLNNENKVIVNSEELNSSNLINDKQNLASNNPSYKIQSDAERLEFQFLNDPRYKYYFTKFTELIFKISKKVTNLNLIKANYLMSNCSKLFALHEGTNEPNQNSVCDTWSFTKKHKKQAYLHYLINKKQKISTSITQFSETDISSTDLFKSIYAHLESQVRTNLLLSISDANPSKNFFHIFIDCFYILRCYFENFTKRVQISSEVGEKKTECEDESSLCRYMFYDLADFQITANLILRVIFLKNINSNENKTFFEDFLNSYFKPITIEQTHFHWSKNLEIDPRLNKKLIYQKSITRRQDLKVIEAFKSHSDAFSEKPFNEDDFVVENCKYNQFLEKLSFVPTKHIMEKKCDIECNLDPVIEHCISLSNMQMKIIPLDYNDQNQATLEVVNDFQPFMSDNFAHSSQNQIIMPPATGSIYETQNLNESINPNDPSFQHDTSFMSIPMTPRFRKFDDTLGDVDMSYQNNNSISLEVGSPLSSIENLIEIDSITKNTGDKIATNNQENIETISKSAESLQNNLASVNNLNQANLQAKDHNNNNNNNNTNNDKNINNHRKANENEAKRMEESVDFDFYS